MNLEANSLLQQEEKSLLGLSGKAALIESKEGIDPVLIERYVWEDVAGLPDDHVIKRLGLTSPEDFPKTGPGIIDIDRSKFSERDNSISSAIYNSSDILITKGLGPCLFFASFDGRLGSLAHMLSMRYSETGYRNAIPRIVDGMRLKETGEPLFFGGGMMSKTRGNTRIKGVLRDTGIESDCYDVSGPTGNMFKVQDFKDTGATTVVVIPKERRIIVLRSGFAADRDDELQDFLK